MRVNENQDNTHHTRGANIPLQQHVPPMPPVKPTPPDNNRK